uniref:Uncharacterized protein n=1 Tax=Pyrodinium bahamense TaxID=73915 RepID=A0A7S0B5Q3_9DINO|mmetsp:Transcript_51178/g.141727  ORF Transcript_51178/g.141727 Transcript_51178/m.141727 type:complete len:148 (+) Transcript_51178:73-516(+)
MRLLRALLLAAALASIACSQEGEDAGPLEEEDGLEEEEQEDQDLMLPEEELPEQQGPLLGHKHGTACVKMAEELETSIGLFDDFDMGDSSRDSLAQKMHEHAETLLGRSSPNFRHAMHAKLSEVHSSQAGFGAHDACEFLLRHHGEL